MSARLSRHAICLMLGFALAACASGQPGPAGPGAGGGPGASLNQVGSSPTLPPGQTSPPTTTGHYRIDVANVGGGHHEGPGHYEGDGAVECGYTPASGWNVLSLFNPNEAGRQVAHFSIDEDPGHEFVEMILVVTTTDAPFTWSVLAGFDNPVFHFTANDQATPVTITAVASDKSNTITITVTCSQVDR